MSGFCFVPPAENRGHLAVPARGTWVTAAGTAPAEMPPAASDYPLAAACKVCGGRITLTNVMQLEWRHAPAAAAGGTP